MRIQSIDCLGLFGKSPKGGWSNEIQPDDSIHALIVVRTDEGHLGIGSVFTDARLVEAALAVLRPLYLGENAIEPMRVKVPEVVANCCFGGIKRNVLYICGTTSLYAVRLMVNGAKLC